MKDPLHATLRTILKAICFASPDSFLFADNPFVRSADDPPDKPPAQLSELLYQHCYCRSFTYQSPQPPPSPLKAGADLLAELVVANQGQDRLDTNWQVLNAFDNGQIIAEKNGRTRLLQPGGYLTHAGAGLPPHAGQSASVYIPRGSAEQQPGFYFVFGETLGDQQDEENIVRIYWHLKPEGAAPLISVLTRTLNRWQVPFRFKALRQREAYQRADAAVLYLNRRYFSSVAVLLADIYGEVAGYLRPETPLFAKRLADGLGLAEDPGNGESFGQHRCRLLGEGIWHAYEQGARTLPQRMKVVSTYFANQGVDLALPYLNTHSTDIYEFGVPDSANSIRQTTPATKTDAATGTRDGEFLETAATLAAQICRDAIWSGGRCNWLGPSLENIGGKWLTVHRAYGPDVYSGTSGVALFLGRLYALTGERLLRVTAEGALAQCLSRLDDIRPTVRAGFYAGWSGIAYVLAQLAEVFDAPRYGDEARRLLRRLMDEPLQPESLDVIGGSAGTVQAALAWHTAQPQTALLELADKHGRHLLATARQSAAGYSWRTLGAEAVPRDLTGYSHGTAGIGLALLELHQATGEPEFQVAGKAAFAYERHWFDAQRGNWPDFRANATAGEWPAYGMAWCHGAPGIGLARLRAWELAGEAAYRVEAETAVRTTITALEQLLTEPLGDFSLCHGATGRAEFLLSAAQTLTQTDCFELAARLGKAGIAQFGQSRLPWPCGVPRAGEAPNLLLGLAGIGHFYLRLAAVNQVPSILCC